MARILPKHRRLSLLLLILRRHDVSMTHNIDSPGSSCRSRYRRTVIPVVVIKAVVLWLLSVFGIVHSLSSLACAGKPAKSGTNATPVRIYSYLHPVLPPL
jgi:hypothetical protein